MADVTKPIMDGHLTEEQLVWHYYGEDGDSAEAGLHLELCAHCRKEFESLKLTMKAVEAWPIPDRTVQYGEEVWRSLRKRDASFGRPLPWWRKWLAPGRLAVVASAVAMLLVAFFAGRVSHKMEQPELAAAPEVIRERILAAALSEHLEASQRVLMELTNSESVKGLDIRDEQRQAQSLLKSNRIYRLTAEREGQSALAVVLDDLERVLLAVSHGPGELTPEEVRQLRARVEDQGLLFKVRVLELRLRDMENQPVPRQPVKEMKGSV